LAINYLSKPKSASLIEATTKSFNRTSLSWAMACSKQKNSVWFLSFPEMNFTPEYIHNRKNQGSILIKNCGKQKGGFRQFDGLRAAAVFSMAVGHC
jgi:hypothetical protein